MPSNSPADSSHLEPAVQALFVQYGAIYKWLVTGTVMIGTLSTVLSITMISVAFPDIMGQFGIGQDHAQWLVTGFLAAMTATMLLTAWLEQTLGVRKAFIFSLLLFAGASVISGLSPSEDVLILGRILQGAAAGTVQPLTMLTMFKIFPPNERGRAMGFFGMGVVLAPALGPTVGGLLIDAFSWRAVFYVVLPFCSLSIMLASIFLPPQDKTTRKVNFDWTGFTLLCLFLGCILTALSNGQSKGWTSNWILFFFVVSAITSIAFLRWQLITPSPLLNLRLFLNKHFAAASALGFVFGMGIFGSTYLIPLFVQTIQGYTPTKAGLLLMPAGFIMGIMFPLAGHLTDRYPGHWLTLSGLTLFGYSCLLLGVADFYTSFWLVAWWVVMGRIGLSLVMPPLTAGAMRTLPPELLSQGAGAINFVRQLGGAFGVNLLSVFLAYRTQYHSDHFTTLLVENNATTEAFLTPIQDLLAQGGVESSLQTPAAMHYLGSTLLQQAATVGFQDGFIVSAIAFFLALIPAWIMRQKKTVH